MKPFVMRGSIAIYFYRLNQAGGAERIVCSLASQLCERGFDIHLISWDDDKTCAFYPIHKEVIWHKLNYQDGLSDKLRRCMQLFRVLRKNHIKVIVGFVMSGDKTVYTAAKLAQTRIVAAERNAPIMYKIRHNKLQRFISFFLLHFVERIVVQFQHYARGYPKTLQNKIVCIPNPVPVSQNRATPGLPDGSGRFILLTVSRLDGVQKRLDCLIDAFALIANYYSDWDLRIVGDGPQKMDLLKRITKLGLTKRIHLEGSSNAIFNAYCQSHLFVIPSLWEGFSNALAEALSHGLPAIGFQNTPGVSDLIYDGLNGWLVKGAQDENSLSCILEMAMKDQGERIRRGAFAAKSMADYAPKFHTDRWSILLDELIVEGRREPAFSNYRHNCF